MKTLTKVAALAVLLLGFVLPATVAGAQTYPSPPPPDLPPTDTPTEGTNDDQCVPDADDVDSDGPGGIDDEVACDEACIPDDDTVDSDGPGGTDDEVACDDGEVLPDDEETTGGGSTGGPGEGEESPRGDEGDVAPTVVENENTAGAAAGAETAPSGSLPITGGDVVGMAVMGGAALAIGAALVMRSRRMRSTTAA